MIIRATYSNGNTSILSYSVGGDDSWLQAVANKLNADGDWVIELKSKSNNRILARYEHADDWEIVDDETSEIVEGLKEIVTSLEGP